MRILNATLFGLLFVGTPLAAAATPRDVPVAWRAPRAMPGSLDDARALVTQAHPHVEQAMNPDNSPSDRKKGRKAAYKLLKSARQQFDDYLDANPSETEALDKEYCSLSANLYWIKKFATLNEFRGESEVTLPPGDADDGDTNDDNAESTKKSGIGGTSKRDDPEPAGGDDEPPPKKSGENGDAPPDPAEAPTMDPAQERANEARRVFAALTREESRRPGDVAHLHALYEKFLFEYDDPSLRVYQKAALRLGALTDRMKDVLKDQYGFDPDDFDVEDSAAVTRVVKRLSDMLRKGDQDARRRSSELLGKLATGAAGYPLAKVLFDKDDVVAKNASDGLIAIGGKRVATNLTKLYRDANIDKQHGALHVLTQICQASDTDARSVSHAIGRFVLSREERVSDTALESLARLGPAGVPGLLEGLSTRDTEKRVQVIRALGDTGHVPATPRIAMYLLPGSKPRAQTQREAALGAIEKFGLPAVPYLIVALKDTKRKVIVRDALTMLTGQRFSAARPGDWQRWWKRIGSKQVDGK